MIIMHCDEFSKQILKGFRKQILKGCGGFRKQILIGCYLAFF